jgi:hypothetical protein
MNDNNLKLKNDTTEGCVIPLPKAIATGDIPWTQDEEDFLRDNISKLSISEIYEHFSYRSHRSVGIKISRLKLPAPRGGKNKELVSRNIVWEMLEHRIGDPSNFKPQRDFYQRVKIPQKRFGQLLRGEKNITEPEYLALSNEWKISLKDAFEMRQLKLEF